MALTVDPKKLTLPAAGGNCFFNLTSSFDGRSCFKVKISNLELYRVKPVYGFVEPKGSAKIEVMRFAGAGKDGEKMVIQWVEVPADEEDATASFKASAQSGEVTIPLKTT